MLPSISDTPQPRDTIKKESYFLNNSGLFVILNIMKLDRTKLSIVALKDGADTHFWATRDPLDRLRAVQIDRQVAYGRTSTSRRLQRVLEVAERI